MKTAQSDHYTDKILFEEGFFENEQEEQKFLEKIQRSVQSAIVENKAIAKGALISKSYIIKIAKRS